MAYRKKVILACTGDTKIDNAFPDQNFGAATTIDIWMNPPEIKTAYSFFKFELLPGGNYETIELYLYTKMDTYYDADFYIHKRIDSWDENTSTWNNTTKNYGDQVARVQYSKAQIPANNNKYYSFNLKNIQAYLEASNNGFILRTAGGFVTFNTRENASNKPYIIAYLNNNDPYEPIAVSPSGTLKSGKVTFSWTYNSAGKGDSQTGVDIDISSNGQNWNTTHIDTAQQQTILDGTAIPVGNCYWRVRSYNNLGGISDWSEIKQFTYEAIEPLAPTELAPVNVSLYGIIEATWQHNPSDEPGDVQAGYNIAFGYEEDEAEWIILSRTSTVAKHVFGLETLQTGKVYFKVQTKNNYGGVSPWSETVSFTFMGYAPRRPTIVRPAGMIVENQDVLFVWQYGGAGIQTRYELQYSLNGTTWKTVAADSASETVTVPKVNFETGTVWWKVRTKNDYGYYSDWSTTTTFTFAGIPKVPTIISPDSFSVANVKVEWTSSEQVAFHLKILAGETPVVDTGEIVSTTQKSYTQTLENKKTYTVQLRVKNMFDFWSGWATQTIAVDFDVPAKPQIFVMSNERRGSVEISIVNGAGEVEFKENEVFRREHGEEEWIKIAAGLGENAKYEDCAVVSEEAYEYKARAVGVTLGYQDSDVSGMAKVKIRHTQLANTADYTQYIELIYNPKRTRNFSFEEELVHFAGRKKPVVERGEQEDANMMLSFIVRDHEDLEKLIDLIKQRETILLRDGRKKKMYVSINNLQVQEDWHNKQYEVSFTVNEVDFQEEVS